MEEKLQKGIEELVSLGLYPVAFEAPHYAISRTVYQIVANYFSTIVGQLQLSNTTWVGTQSPYYISTPTFAASLQVIPETLGYIEKVTPATFNTLKANAEKITSYIDSILGVFYHPYLGLDGLIQTVEIMESFKNIPWYDIKNDNHEVKTDEVSIKVVNGEIVVNSPYPTNSFAKGTILTIALSVGGLTLLVIIFIVLFCKKRDNTNESRNSDKKTLIY